MAPHLAVLNEHLVAIEQRRLKRLIVQLPVRHGKSELITGNFVAWYLGLHPDESVMVGGYNQKFVRKWGRFARNKLHRWGEAVFGAGVRVDRESSAADEWNLADPYRGGYFATSVGGGGTGRGGTVLVIDDPIKNAREANSQTYRDIVDEDFYRGTFRSRLEPVIRNGELLDGAIVIVMSRWHEDDLVGRVLQRERLGQPEVDGDENSYAPEPWTVIDLPAIALEDGADGPKGPGTYHDALGRRRGEALWADRWPLRALYALKSEMGSPGFSANMQQRPQAAEGGMFQRKWFRYFTFRRDPVVGGWFLCDDNERFSLASCEVFQIVDLAISEREEAAFTAIGTFALEPRSSRLFVVHMYRDHIPAPRQIEKLKELWLQFRPDYIGIESKAYQRSAVQYAVQAFLPAVELDPGKDDKITRAITIAARIEAGSVFFPRAAHWLEDLQNELVVFPKADIKDQVDVMAYAGLHVVSAANVRRPAGRHS